MIKLKSLALIIGLGTLVTACGGGGGGTVSNVSTPVTPEPIVIADRPDTMNFDEHLSLHNEGFTGENMRVSVGVQYYLSPEGRRVRNIVSGAESEFNLQYQTGEAGVENTDLESDNSIIFDINPDSPFDFSDNARNAFGTAIVWDKFDTKSGTEIRAIVDATADRNGVINLERAMSPVCHNGCR